MTDTLYILELNISFETCIDGSLGSFRNSCNSFTKMWFSLYRPTIQWISYRKTFQQTYSCYNLCCRNKTWIMLEHRVPIYCRHHMTIASLRCNCTSFYKLYYSLGLIVRLSLAVRLSNSVYLVASLQNCVCRYIV